MMIIQGKLVKIDMGEMEGKPYGEIFIFNETGKIGLRYPLGAEIELPEIGSTVEAEFSGKSLRTLERITLISLPVKIDTTIPTPVKKPEKPDSNPDAFWKKSYMGFGISTRPLDWLVMIGLVSMGIILYNLGDIMAYWYFYPESINLVRDLYISLSFSSSVIMIISGIFLVITKNRILGILSMLIALGAGVICTLFWSSILTTELLMYDEEQIVEIYSIVTILITILSFIGILYYARSDK